MQGSGSKLQWKIWRPSGQPIGMIIQKGPKPSSPLVSWDFVVFFWWWPLVFLAVCDHSCFNDVKAEQEKSMAEHAKERDWYRQGLVNNCFF